MQRIRFIAITALALLVTNAAYAQDAAAPAAAPTLTPPKLVKASQPVYPKGKLESGVNATVALVLTLDDTGKVTDVAVATSAGDEFDQAALDAAQQMEFAPAERDGKPVPAKIPFRIQFEAQAPAPALAAAAPAAPAAPAPAVAASTATVPAAADALDIDVEGERPAREPTQRTVTAEEIRKIPGTNGDALRAIGNMPGVARVGAFDGLLIVRGSSPRDTQVFVDGTGIPLVYHFGGLSSVVPSEMLERIDFYPGNFGPQYGRATGGIVDVGIRSPKKDKLHGLVQVDLIDARLMVEAPINESTRFMIGGRRSWLDAWLGPVLKNSGVGVTAAPVYYDYQAMIEHDLTKNTTVRLLALGSDDGMKLTLNSPDSKDPAFGGDAGLHQSFWRIQGRVDTRPTDKVRWTTTFSVGQTTENTNIGGMYLDVKDLSLEGRSDVRAKLAPSVTAIAGIDMVRNSFDASYRLPATSFESEQDTGPTSVFAMGEGASTATLTIPMDAIDSLPAAARGAATVGVLSVACPGDLSFGVGPGGLPTRCQEIGTGRDMELDEFIVGYKRIAVRQEDRNQNPELIGITFDGADWPATETKLVGFCDQADFIYDTCPDAEKHQLAATVSSASFESGNDELGRPFEEQLVIQHYATEGIFEFEVRTGKSPQTGWVARKSASGQTLSMWFVARDDRGGVTWAERKVTVR